MKDEAAQFASVAAGAWLGMLWPYPVKLLRTLSPKVALDAMTSLADIGHRQMSSLWRLIGWLALTVFVAAAVTAFNIVPIVTSEVGDKLVQLGGWQYFFLLSEG
jgi:hypothetical protein